MNAGPISPRRAIQTLLFTVLLGFAPVSVGWEYPDQPGRSGWPQHDEVANLDAEPWNSGWSIAVDNDLLAGHDKDRDYTGGLAVTLGGKRASESALSLDPALSWLNRKLPTGAFHAVEGERPPDHSLQFGLAVFTPDIRQAGPVHDDRPYASLAWLSNSQYLLHPLGSEAFQSTLTVGLLGTSIGEWTHKAVHRLVGSDRPEGYAHQISDDGELTARYALAYHRLLASGRGERSGYDVKLMAGGSIGYLTEADVSLGIRWGRIATPWWRFYPDVADYGAQPPAAPSAGYGRGRDRYLWANFKLRARAYNALLQGQFRDSPVTWSSSDLHHLQAEVAVGLVIPLPGFDLNYAFRVQTREIRHGQQPRFVTWGGVTLSRSF
ncbi:lipid A deacylase LpxR family protein [Elongatibacter sediminis]|uniref:Lipid A deacylase LpxR family protein n=1 Tax=Elongatibacter sediminis TaxID=3119006 RepID=A0AAW9R9P0_9GAMM